MWQERSHGRSRWKYSATDLSLMSLAFEFQVMPTLGWPQASMTVLTYGGWAVPLPWTSTQISTPASAAALPHGTRALPICSSVFSTGTSLGRPLGRTLTPRPPMSAASSTNSLQVSMFFLTTSGSGEWNSQTLPQPQTSTPPSAKRLRTSLRSTLLNVGSTPCLCVVRSSTGETPVALQIL